MLTSIQFDYEASFQADKVGNVRPYRMLPPDLELLEIPIPEQLPQPQLRIGKGLAQLPCSFAKLW